MTVSRIIHLDDLNPGELADLFCEMDDHQQAEFFEAIHRIAKDWPGAGWCQQSCSIAGKLSDEGREAIRTLAGHALPELAEQ